MHVVSVLIPYTLNPCTLNPCKLKQGMSVPSTDVSHFIKEKMVNDITLDFLVSCLCLLLAAARWPWVSLHALVSLR
jgi:hypothetical protein